MADIRMRTARTHVPEPEAAAEELLRQLGGAVPRLVTLFASRERDQGALNRAVRARLPSGTRLLGATTSGELDNGGFHKGAVVLGALWGDFEVGLGLGSGLSVDAERAGEEAMRRACDALGTRPESLDMRRHVGLVLDDGHRYRKAELLDGMLARNRTLLLVGGGASDPDLVRGAPLLHVDGEVVADGALLALFRTEAPWAALRTHWYWPTGQTLRITRVDPTRTRALEIDGKPAARRYAELLGVSVDELEFGKPRGFATRPTATRVGTEYFLRAPWRVEPDGSILFTHRLTEGDPLELMRLGDMVERTRGFFLEDVPRRVAHPQAALLFHCSARTLFAETTGTLPRLSTTLRHAPPAVGFDCHFEIDASYPTNTTLTALVFGRSW
jgi:hypothetical protein